MKKFLFFPPHLHPRPSVFVSLPLFVIVLVDKMVVMGMSMDMGMGMGMVVFVTVAVTVRQHVTKPVTKAMGKRGDAVIQVQGV